MVGSLNVDIFLQVDRMPLFGETISTNKDISKMFGGKGLNQAVACAKLNN